MERENEKTEKKNVKSSMVQHGEMTEKKEVELKGANNNSGKGNGDPQACVYACVLERTVRVNMHV